MTFVFMPFCGTSGTTYCFSLFGLLILSSWAVVLVDFWFVCNCIIMMNVILIEGKSGGEEEEEVAGSTVKLKLSISDSHISHTFISPLCGLSGQTD